MNKQDLEAIRRRYAGLPIVCANDVNNLLAEIYRLQANNERLTEELSESRNINFTQAQDLANYENMLAAFDNEGEPSASVLVWLMNDEEELRKWMNRCSWHCRKVNEQSKEIDRLQAEWDAAVEDLSNSFPSNCEFCTAYNDCQYEYRGIIEKDRGRSYKCWQWRGLEGRG